MYVGSVSDFFFKNKNWLISLPKITNENKFQVVKMGNKFFQLNIYTGVLQKMNQNNLNNCENSLNAKRSKTQDKAKKEKISSKTYTNMKFNMKNQKEESDMLPKNSQDKDENENDNPLVKKLKKELAHKRNKSSNINNDFCLTSKYFMRNKKNKNKNHNSASVADLYLNQKYISINGIKKFKSRNFLTCDNSKKVKLKSNSIKSTFIPKTKSKKIIINGINDNMSENIYFPEDNKYEINKEDNEFTANVKNEMFKNKMFRLLQKQYNFYNDYKNKNDIFTCIPKLKLKTAKSIYIEKKKPLTQKLYLSKL